jgi:cytochrome o ubiquinol oxidase operon protein cyoD
MEQPNKYTQAGHGSVASYSIGFILSLVLTMTAYLSVVNHWLAGKSLMALIIGLAIAQLMVQLLFFLHLGSEAKPRHRLLIFLFMAMVLAIVVAGSIWIMDSLNYRMDSHEVNDYIIKDEGIPEQ